MLVKKSKFSTKRFIKDLKNNIKKHPPQKNPEADERLDEMNEAYVGVEEESKVKSNKKSKRFFDKVGGFFDPEPQKERVLSKEDFRAAGDVYYASVSAFYKVFERILWVLLILFLVFSLLTNYKDITFNNFFYLLKDFSNVSDNDASNYQVLSYDSDKRQKFELFHGGIVSAAPSSVSIFTSSGRRSFKSNNDYYSPNVVASDKYVLVYDSANASFSVYNSFSKVYNKTFEDPITDAEFAEDGSFAIATRQADLKTVIYLYNKNIKERGYISQSDYVFDMALSTKENRLATISYLSASGTGETLVTFYDTEDSKSAGKLFEHSFSAEFPISCAYLENGDFILITNQAIRVFDDGFDLKEQKQFFDFDISAFNASLNGAVVVTTNGAVKNVYAVGENGDFIFDGTVGENVKRADVFEDSVFLQTASGVIRIDADTGDRDYLPSSQGDMLVYDEDTAIVCGYSKAEYLVFE